MNRKVAIVVVLALVACVGTIGVLAGYFIVAGRSLPPSDAVAEDQPEAPPATQTQSPAEPPPESLPPSLDAIEQMSIIESQVSDLRQLQPTGEVTKAFQTQEGLRQTLEESFAEEYSPEEARDDALVLSTFDFLAPDFDLYAFFIDLYTEQIAGYYDTETKEFFVISSNAELSEMDRLTFAHEYNHALQDQHYDLEAFNDNPLYEENYDADLALTALIEGDAQLLTIFYFSNHFTDDDMTALFAEFDTLDFPLLDSAPQIIQNDLSFPYTSGMTFVEELYDEGGWQLVNQAFANPPASTEQILHPQRYLDDEQPQVVTLQPALDALGPLWRLVDEDTFGEFYLTQYLDQHLDSSHSSAAADGWGGDLYAVYYNESNSQLVMLLNIVWDTSLEAGEFAEAYRQFGTARAASEPTTASSELTCWTALDYLCMWHSQTQTLIFLAPDLATLQPLLAQYNITN